jgi:zinc transporter 9
VSASTSSSVIAALIGNGFITVLKFAAFAVSGSGAMLSEAIHSLADTGNQALLFVGIQKGKRAGDRQFHYGYGGDRYIFGLLSASGIFFVGCGVTVYHGISSLLHAHQPEIGWSTFAVLGVSFLVEGGVLLFAIRSITRVKGEMSFLRYVRERADPATVAVLLEDGVAVLGLLLASVGISLAYLTGNAFFDSIGSIVVGVLLGLVAVFLVLENRALLLGRAVPPEMEEKFRRIVNARPGVREVHDVKTEQLTPEVYRFKAEVRFEGSVLRGKLAPVVNRAPKIDDATVTELAQTAIEFLCDEIDAIEREVRAAIPEAHHIDLVIDRGLAQGPPSTPQAEPEHVLPRGGD